MRAAPWSKTASRMFSAFPPSPAWMVIGISSLRQRKCLRVRRSRIMKFVARQINADDTLLTILLRQLHRIDVLLWCNRPIAAEDQATANAEIALTASQSFERG